MDEIRTTGKTVDDALTEALIQLGTTSDKVEYEVIEKGSSGFFGIGSKPAVIVVKRKTEKKEHPESKTAQAVEKAEKKAAANDVKAKETEKKAAAYEGKEKETDKKTAVYDAKTKETDKKTAAYDAKAKEADKNIAVEKTEKKETAPVAEQKPAKPVTPLNGEEIKEKLNVFLGDLFKTMNMDVEIKYQIDEAARMVGIELEGNEMGILIGKRGQTLDSLQYLISLVANKDTNEYIRVKLDTENYRRRRRATLENLAKNIAYKVKRERKAITLEPMNPYERRIIHSTLQNDRYVETHSEGAEPYRRVVVSLKKNQ